MAGHLMCACNESHECGCPHISDAQAESYMQVIDFTRAQRCER